MVNFFTEQTRRVDMLFGIGYSDDIEKAKQVLNRLVEADKRILKEPEAQTVVAELADSSVSLKSGNGVIPQIIGGYISMCKKK